MLTFLSNSEPSNATLLRNKSVIDISVAMREWEDMKRVKNDESGIN